MAKVQANKKTKTNKFWYFLRELISIFLWVYVFIKLMIFDIDVYLVEKIQPSYMWLVEYKFLAIISVISIVWLLLGNKKFGQLSLYAIFYPFIVILWKLPKLIFFNWSVAIIVAPVAFNILSSLRWVFIRNTLLLVAYVMTLVSHDNIMLHGSIFVVLFLLIFKLFSAFQQAYKTTVFLKISKALSDFKEKMSDIDFIEKMISKTTSSESTPEIDKHRIKLSTVYMFSSGIEFFADKVHDVLRSRKMDIFLVLSWLWTVIFTILSFSFIYFSLHKIDERAFSANYELNYFSFLGYSIGKLMPSSVSTISPSSTLAISLSYFEIASSVLIIVILVFTILTATRERYREDIEKITEELSEINVLFHKGSEKLYNLAISDVEGLLLDGDQDFVNWVRKIRGMPKLLPKEVESTKTSS